MTCPACAPHPPHAGRCSNVAEVAPGRLAQCRCELRWKEEAHGPIPDSVPDGGDTERGGGAVGGVSPAQAALTATLSEIFPGGR